MSKGIDLKMNVDDAQKLLAQTAEASAQRLRDLGSALAEELAATETARSTLSPDITKAAVAAVIDFDQPYDSNGSKQLQLAFNGGSGGGYVDLQRGLSKGRYRAIITITRIEE